MSRLNRRLLLIGACLAGLLGLYALAGYVVAPLVLERWLPVRLEALTGRAARVADVRIDPFRLRLTVQGLALEQPGGPPAISLQRLHVDVRWRSLAERTLILGELTLSGPRLRLERTAQGRLNVADLLERVPADGGGAPLPVRIETLGLGGGQVSLDGLQPEQPFRTVIESIDVEVTDLSTGAGEASHYRLSARTSAGERLSVTGRLSAVPAAIDGTLRLDDLRLERLAGYLAPFTTAAVAGGRLDLRGRFELAAGATLPVFEDVAVELRDLDLRTAGGDELIALPRLALEGTRVHPADRTVAITALRAEDATVHLRRQADGTLEPASVLRLPEGDASGAPSWGIDVAQIALSGFDVRLEDARPREPVALRLEQLSLEASGLSTRPGAPVSATLSFRGESVGEAKIEGDGTLQPPAGEAEVRVAGVALAVLQPYVPEWLRVRIADGRLAAEGRVRYRPAAEGPAVRFEGGASIEDLAIRDPAGEADPPVVWERMAAEGLTLALAPARLDVETLRLRGLHAAARIGAAGEVNLLSLVERDGAAAGSGAAALPIRLGQLVLEDASLDVRDASVTPAFSGTVETLSGTVSGLDFPVRSAAGVDLRGRLSALEPFELHGTLLPDPERPSADLTLSAQKAELARFTPYSIGLIGHAIEQGHATVELSYQVAEQRIEGRNHVVIQGLTLGPPQAVEAAVDAPVELGLSLLTDRQGRMEIEVPVTGDLSAPQFSLEGVISRAFGGFFSKVLTSPFAFLGAVFGGGEALQYVEFEPGRARIVPSQTDKLEKLARALYDRPRLELLIRGAVAPAQDREALALVELERRLRGLRFQELLAEGAAPEAPEQLDMPPDVRERLLRELYRRMRAEPARVEAPGPAPGDLEPRGLERWLVDAIEVGDRALEDLLRDRAEAVRRFLLAQRELDPGRLSVQPGRVGAEPHAPRAVFALD